MLSKLVPKPFNDQERIEALQALGILGTSPEVAFDRITRLAAEVMRAPVALISLIGEDQQWFKSCYGIDLDTTPREIAFCAHAIMNDNIMVVLDAAKDRRFQDNPFVTGAAHIRFYAGAPLITRDGFRIGTLCVIDTEARTRVTDRELALLKDLATMTIEAIEDRQALRHASENLSRHLAAADERAEAGEAAKANLLAILGHELRTPLNAIIGFSEVMTGQAFGPLGSPQYKDYAEHIRESGEHLLGLIGTLLSFASCDRGEIILNDEVLDTGQIIEGCVGMMSERARKAGVDLVAEVAPGLPSLRADRNQVVQMLLNLIGNAIKFNRPEGKARVAANLEDGRMVLVVTDTGNGMPSERLDQSREAFDQLESGLARRFEGLGLGLPLTERLIELHGGKLSLQSIESQGTTAILTFPEWRTGDGRAAAPLTAVQGS